MEIRRYRVRALTPVHIGSGRPIAPEEYFIRDNRMVRFRPEAVMRRWSEDERRRFQQHVGAGRLAEAWAQLRQAAERHSASWLYEIAVGEGSMRELGSGVDPSRRRGEVYSLPWNLGRRQAVVPGSAIKGALRTAILNAVVAHDSDEAAALVGRLKGSGAGWRRGNEVWRRLESWAFRLERRRDAPEPLDPLALLQVSDAAVPEGMIRVDRAQVIRRAGGQATRGIQIHCERLVSAADDPEKAASFELEIRLATERTEHPEAGRRVQLRLGWDFLRQAANAFYYGRMRAERERFGFLADTARWLPAGDPWETGGILMRIGRFSHFESLSVDKLRDGWNAARRAGMTEGDSRTVIELGDGKVSFGWVRLEPVG